jgi:flagellar hook assembly protein FlgD
MTDISQNTHAFTKATYEGVRPEFKNKTDAPPKEVYVPSAQQNFGGIDFKSLTTDLFDGQVDPTKMNDSLSKHSKSQVHFAQQILLAQLKHQTIGNEMDANKMVESLMGMVTIAQNEKMAENTDKNIRLQTAMFSASLNSYMGQEVEHTGNDFDYQNYDQEVICTLPDKVDLARVIIKDDRGRVIKHADLSTEPGRKSFIWNGRNDNDESMPKGLYKAEVYAFDEDNKPISIVTRLKSRITDVAYDDKQLAVLMSGNVPIYNIQRASMIDKALGRYAAISSSSIETQTMDTETGSTGDVESLVHDDSSDGSQTPRSTAAA